MILSDEEIERLLALPKTISNPKARRKVQKKSMRINYTVLAEGAAFEVYVRQNQLVADAFSCGLTYLPQSGDKVTLMRCNGPYHPHGNPLEGVSTIGVCCHIHKATHRYMVAGRKPEHYAEPTNLYSDVNGALLTLMDQCNITGLDIKSADPYQNDLFPNCDDQS
ncbi:hypothetical protein [Alcaligenes faecalis]|uniref:hypothetical protein n=1 Tax=Alcaligenes faecalis TaxID=511 RepID=UPI001C839B13|nr:hypothetical protein [Alcaligenes faecalis]MBX6966021.1 hypothetical protein [Providencia rettgeri]MBX7031176.1 hypothetical protein [Alcaligenes faecalis]